MVVTYLEKIRNRYVEQKNDINTQLSESISHRKENMEFIKMLEQDNDLNFEAFTPRTINSFNKNKIIELMEKQKIIEEDIEKLENQLLTLDDELREIAEVIKFAKRR